MHFFALLSVFVLPLSVACCWTIPFMLGGTVRSEVTSEKPSINSEVQSDNHSELGCLHLIYFFWGSRMSLVKPVLLTCLLHADILYQWLCLPINYLQSWVGKWKYGKRIDLSVPLPIHVSLLVLPAQWLWGAKVWMVMDITIVWNKASAITLYWFYVIFLSKTSFLLILMLIHYFTLTSVHHSLFPIIA